MKQSYGFIETCGLIGAIEAADAMVKAAKVQLLNYRKIGSGLVTVIVEGELSACQAAVDAGRAAAERTGELVSSNIIANPYPDTELFLQPPAQQKRVVPKKRVAKKKAVIKAVPKKQIVEKNQQVVEFLSKKKNGATLKELAALLGKSVADSRPVLKKMMDDGRIEKVQQRYFLV